MNVKSTPETVSRRDALIGAGQALAAIAVVMIGTRRAVSKSTKAAKEDFFFQEEPGENGKRCETCINFTPKPNGQYGADSGDCGLLEGDVCKHCYCQGWTDKNDPKSKKAGT